ncbi:MAG: hypothetical protein ACI9TV_002325 [Sulfurimonas sp.]|jgi:hypothetical protein|uniref:hypothetical protein n=1 Tax=Sulfurimonas sp. TaxID=2022749 RepID=UPI0039E5A21F
MKTILTLISFISLGLLHANESWIKINPINKTQTPKVNIKPDVNLSQIEPINKMIKKATAIKQLIDVARKQEKQITNDKNWFSIKTEGSK